MYFGSKGGHPLRLAASQGDGAKAGAEKGIESVKTNAPGAALVDLIEELAQRNSGVSAVR